MKLIVYTCTRAITGALAGFAAAVTASLLPDRFTGALVACARKMLVFANTVVARGTPWQDRRPENAALTTG